MMWERNIIWSPPIKAVTGDQIYNLGMYPDGPPNSQPLVCKTMLYTMEPPDQGGHKTCIILLTNAMLKVLIFFKEKCQLLFYL